MHQLKGTLIVADIRKYCGASHSLMRNLQQSCKLTTVMKAGTPVH